MRKRLPSADQKAPTQILQALKLTSLKLGALLEVVGRRREETVIPWL